MHNRSNASDMAKMFERSDSEGARSGSGSNQPFQYGNLQSNIEAFANASRLNQNSEAEYNHQLAAFNQ